MELLSEIICLCRFVIFYEKMFRPPSVKLLHFYLLVNIVDPKIKLVEKKKKVGNVDVVRVTDAPSRISRVSRNSPAQRDSKVELF